MESIGEKLRLCRESKGYSLDQVARDTHITKRFLEALEYENFSSLPGESYVIGFLRSYSEYLGLNSEEVVTLYKNLKLQEQPAPMNELLDRRRLSTLGIVLIVLLTIAVFTIGGVIVYNSSLQPIDGALEAPSPSPSFDPQGTFFTGSSLERSFTVGESIRVPVSGVEYELLIGIRNGQAQITLNGTPISLPIGTEAELDFNQDGKMDLVVLVREVNERANPATLVLSLNRIVQSPVTGNQVQPDQEVEGTGASINFGTSNQPSRQKQKIVLTEYTNNQVISLVLRFDARVPFRYETDGIRREERLSNFGETISITANSSIRLWFGNGGRSVMRIGSRELRAGSEGEVSVWSLVWSGEGLNRQLELVPMY